MKRVLVLYFSQTGQLGRAVRSFVDGLDRSELEVTLEPIRPARPYPFPWKIREFFGVFPDCVLGTAPEIEPLSIRPDDRFDLVVLGYTVWFLAPSLPVQGFLASRYAGVLQATPVITLIACRNMWHTASERMKQAIAERGGRLIDNVVLTDDGPAWASFVTTPRWMFTGKRDRFLRVFPPAGISDARLEGVSRFGRAVTEGLRELDGPAAEPFLRGLGAVKVEERYVLPELVGRFSFPFWARVIAACGPPGALARSLATAAFRLFLVFAILVVVPALLVIRILAYPLLRKRIRAYADRLRSPSGV